MMVSNLMSYMCRDEGDLELELPTGFRGILFRDDGFQADREAEAIQAAIKTKGVDEAKIIDVLTKRDNVQRRQIAMAYQMAYGKDMSVALKAALSGELEEVVLGLLKTPAQFDADALHSATKGLGTDEECLIEILATRSNQQLRDIKQAYLATYKVELEKNIASDTSGDFQKLLLTLAKGNRDESSVVNPAQAEADARALFEAGVKRKGTDVATFTRIFTQRSVSQTRRVLVEYKKLGGNDVITDLKKELKGDLEKTFEAIIYYASNPAGYFAQILHDTKKNAVLTRVMVSRCEIDMVDIRREFKGRFKKSLHSVLAAKTKGDYETILLRLCGGED